MIYFIHDAATCQIKIGFTGADAEGRLKSLQTGNPSRLMLLGTMSGEEADEKQLHVRFSDFRVQGEWFRASADLILFIASNCSVAKPSKSLGSAVSQKRRFISFDQLCEIEPRLRLLLREAKDYHKDKKERFCANSVWYGYDHSGGIKRKLCQLVGWERKERDAAANPLITTNVAYDVAYETIYEALPDCDADCACQTVMGAFLGVSG